MGKDYSLSLKAVSLKNEAEVDCIQTHRLAIQTCTAALVLGLADTFTISLH